MYHYILSMVFVNLVGQDILLGAGGKMDFSGFRPARGPQVPVNGGSLTCVHARNIGGP